jgi:hypothetical protein
MVGNLLPGEKRPGFRQSTGDVGVNFLKKLTNKSELTPNLGKFFARTEGQEGASRTTPSGFTKTGGARRRLATKDRLYASR